jgi:hypothetical protein
MAAITTTAFITAAITKKAVFFKIPLFVLFALFRYSA